MIDLPREFELRVRNVWGKKGDKWLEEFPWILADTVQRWQLASVRMHDDLSYNFIAYAVSDEYGDVVLKIGVPTKELETEILALESFSDEKVVRLLDSDRAKGALLLEEIRPAKPLHMLNDNVTETQIAARIIADLPVLAAKQSSFPTVEHWTRIFDRTLSDNIQESLALPVKFIEKAKELTQELTDTTNDFWLLHGDLHHDNILFDNTRGWLAIDPKGVIGDRSYECARFIHNPIPELLSCDDPERQIAERVDIFSAELKEDRHRILGWAFADCILGACWDIEESANGVDFYVEVARIIERLTTN